jgi:flagellar hook assembly protein FlgD
MSESVTATLVVRDASGRALRTTSQTAGVLAFTWNLTVGGVPVPDGAYGWSLSYRDPWGNTGPTRSGTFLIDSKAPTTTAALAATPGTNGWLRSAATFTLTATDATSGVDVTKYRIDAGTATTYSGTATVSAQGPHTFAYRSIDLARNLEAWHTRSVSIDSVAPVVTATMTGTAGDIAGWYRSPVTVALAAKDATSGLRGASYRLDGGASAPLPVSVSADGSHSLVVSATDQAGNVTNRTYAVTVDTVAPVLAVATSAGTTGTATTATFSPNGDGFRDQYTASYTLSEPAMVTVNVRNAAGTIVRKLSSVAAAGVNTVAWDGRTSTGSVAPDGAYRLTFHARDKAGNTSQPSATAVQVFGALAEVHRSAFKFYPQDDDALGRTLALGFTLLRPATVTLRVLDAQGNVIRSRYEAALLPPGTYSWGWNGRRSDGTFVPHGRYSFQIIATDGVASESRLPSVYAGAFQVTPSATTASRGRNLTVTAISSEFLASNPRLYLSQPGLATWSATMSHVRGRTYSATVRLRTGGSAGTLRLWVGGTDVDGGRNRSTTLAIRLR